MKPRNNVLQKATVRVERRNGDDVTFPWYAEMNVCLFFSRHTPCIDFGAMIEVEPVSSSSRYFAMVAVIDNHTQFVTIRTAQ